LGWIVFRINSIVHAYIRRIKLKNIHFIQMNMITEYLYSTSTYKPLTIFSR